MERSTQWGRRCNSCCCPPLCMSFLSSDTRLFSFGFLFISASVSSPALDVPAATYAPIKKKGSCTKGGVWEFVIFMRVYVHLLNYRPPNRYTRNLVRQGMGISPFVLVCVHAFNRAGANEEHSWLCEVWYVNIPMFMPAHSCIYVCVHVYIYTHTHIHVLSNWRQLQGSLSPKR